MRACVLFSAITVLFLFMPSGRLMAQPLAQIPSADRGSSEQPREDDQQVKWRKEAEKKANKERQAQIQRDTEKLLKLATELKEYVGKTDEHILSLDVIKKAEEIERLAHDVKERMKTSY